MLILTANFAWTLFGGDGTGVKLIDLEADWQLDNEDLAAVGIQRVQGRRAADGKQDVADAMLLLADALLLLGAGQTGETTVELLEEQLGEQLLPLEVDPLLEGLICGLVECG